MTVSDQEILSCYRELTHFGTDQQMVLVQHEASGKVFVKKTLSQYNLSVYRYLMEHPVANMPQIYAAIEDDGQLITIEDYLPGMTLQELLDTHGPLPETKVIKIGSQLCRIVAQLHAAVPPIVHRDIKPENILISTDGTVSLLDMNAARQVLSDKAADTRLLGTAGFAAPEQYGFAQSDTRTDIYAIGVLLNVMLTGKFPKDSMAPGRLRPVIKKCTHLDPAGRYKSIEELRNVLTWMATTPPSANDIASHSWKRFLPPGFRTGNPSFMISAMIIYPILIYLGVTLRIDRPLSAADLRLYRILCTIMLLCMALFTGNYLNIQKRIPLANSHHLLLRIIGILLVNFALFAITVILLSIFTE